MRPSVLPSVRPPKRLNHPCRTRRFYGQRLSDSELPQDFRQAMRLEGEEEEMITRPVVGNIRDWSRSVWQDTSNLYAVCGLPLVVMREKVDGDERQGKQKKIRKEASVFSHSCRQYNFFPESANPLPPPFPSLQWYNLFLTHRLPFIFYSYHYTHEGKDSDTTLYM